MNMVFSKVCNERKVFDRLDCPVSIVYTYLQALEEHLWIKDDEKVNSIVTLKYWWIYGDACGYLHIRAICDNTSQRELIKFYLTLTAIIVSVDSNIIFCTTPYAPCPNSPRSFKSSALQSYS